MSGMSRRRPAHNVMPIHRTSPPRWTRTACLALALAVGAPAVMSPAAHAQLPGMGDTNDMTVAAERRLGDRIMREIYRDPDYIDDPLIGEYLQSIWEPLREAAIKRGELTPDIQERFAWVVMQVRDRSVNAFALPGGYMGVHLGLVGTVASRDELASVMAHELSHVTQRHIARMMTEQGRQMPWVLGAMILGVLAAGKSADAANAAIVGGQALAVQNQLNFSRDMEREADRIGYGLMGQAGFDVSGFVTMFEKLQQASRLNDNGSFPYLRSHPLTTQRIADMQLRQQLDEKREARVKTSLEHAVVSARARMMANPSVDALRAAQTQAQASVRGPSVDPRAAGDLYAAAWASMRLREFDRARDFTSRLASLVRDDARASRAARLLRVEIELAEGNAQAALTALGPQADTAARPELFLRAQAESRLGRAADTVPALQSWLARRPGDTAAMQWLAGGYAAQGQPLRALRTEAEIQVMRYDYQAAVDRFRAAQEMIRRGQAGRNPADHVEASIIDTRLREVESLLREQRLER